MYTDSNQGSDPECQDAPHKPFLCAQPPRVGTGEGRAEVQSARSLKRGVCRFYSRILSAGRIGSRLLGLSGERRRRPIGAPFEIVVPPPRPTFLLPLPALRLFRSKMALAAAGSRVSGLLGRYRPQMGRPMSSGAHGEEGSGTGAVVGGSGLSPSPARRGGTVTLA